MGKRRTEIAEKRKDEDRGHDREEGAGEEPASTNEG
jgi:hypothetical protein